MSTVNIRRLIEDYRMHMPLEVRRRQLGLAERALKEVNDIERAVEAEVMETLSAYEHLAARDAMKAAVGETGFKAEIAGIIGAALEEATSRAMADAAQEPDEDGEVVEAAARDAAGVVQKLVHLKVSVALEGATCEARRMADELLWSSNFKAELEDFLASVLGYYFKRPVRREGP